MAVVSISRIQVRRGQKNQGSGLPQLASGEFGWAVDSQELFIGNGSVAEGAPFVGNTKLLSENDNLFEFADTYSYKNSINVQTGDSPNNPVLRTLQARLDDRVSIRSFGANGDGTDQTAALQRAIDQLYLNASNKGTTQARVELILEPGEYNITSTVYLPPFATIRGAGADKTIINSGAFVAFVTVNETSTPGVYASDAVSTPFTQARNISISGLTINSTGGTALALVSCKDSIFRDLILEGSYTPGVFNAAIDGIRLHSLSEGVSSNNNLFENVVVKQFSTAVKSDDDITNNTWTDCTFDTAYQGLAFGLVSGTGSSGPVNNTIINSKFDNIYTTAIQVKNGTGNTSKNNKFYAIGNSAGSSEFNQYTIIDFVTGAVDLRSERNSSTGDWFQRTEELGYDERYKNRVRYYPEVEGPIITELETTYKLSLGQLSDPNQYSKLFRLPADTTKGYEIDYIYRSLLAGTRSGTMTLVVDPINDTYNFSDEYDFTGAGNAQNLKFKAELFDEDATTINDTVAIMMLNLTISDDAELHYKVKIKS
jgi:hypothetical protein